MVVLLKAPTEYRNLGSNKMKMPQKVTRTLTIIVELDIIAHNP